VIVPRRRATSAERAATSAPEGIPHLRISPLPRFYHSLMAKSFQVRRVRLDDRAAFWALMRSSLLHLMQQA